jgi:cytochrome c oxidase assembly protein subunit 15
VLAHADISAAEAALPTGPVTVMKAWIEMIHRYLAMGIGVLIVALMVIAWRKWLKARTAASKPALVFSTLLFAFVCLQGAFGAWTVTMKLQPVIVTIHLLLGMTLLALLTWFGARATKHPPVSTATATLRIMAALAFIALAIQIALGGWVSTNYAVMACAHFLLCQGSLMPQMDFTNGFALWRDLGMTANGEPLPSLALTAIHWTHRAVALIVVALVAWVALQSIRIGGLQRTARWLLGAIVLQFATGVLTVYFNFPLALAVIHNGGAALLLFLLVLLNYKLSFAFKPSR